MDEALVCKLRVEYSSHSWDMKAELEEKDPLKAANPDGTKLFAYLLHTWRTSGDRFIAYNEIEKVVFKGGIGGNSWISEADSIGSNPKTTQAWRKLKAALWPDHRGTRGGKQEFEGTYRLPDGSPLFTIKKTKDNKLLFRLVSPKLFDAIDLAARRQADTQAAGNGDFEASSPRAVEGASAVRSNVPHLRNEYFTGRQEILEALARTAGSNTPVAITQALHGLGGIGKTQTAVEYSYRYGHLYTVILWCRADTTDSLAAGYVDIARFLGLADAILSEEPAIIMAVVEWLGDPQNAGYLLILDNADDPRLLDNFLPRFPKKLHGHVLLTSRRDRFPATIRPISLPFMTMEESVALLYSRTRRARVAGSDDERNAMEIAEILGGLPLALEQAAAYIAAKDRSFAVYLHEFESKQGVLESLMLEPELGSYLRFDPRSQQFKEHLTVWTTWELNFLEVEQTAPSSARVLQLSAYLAPDDIPFELVTIAFPEFFIDALEMEERELIFADLLLPLSKYSLATSMGTLFSVHRLVQSVLRSRMKLDEREAAQGSIILLLNSATPDPTKFENAARLERLRPHVNACTDWMESI